MKNNQSFDLKPHPRGEPHPTTAPSRSSSTKVSANSVTYMSSQPPSTASHLDEPARDNHSVAFLTHENLKLRQENKALKK
jgi:hypothetical protein